MRVVVAIDSAQSSKVALDYLMGGRYGVGDQIHLVHVMVPLGFADVAVAGIPDPVAEERKEEEQILSQMASAIREKLKVEPTIDILTGETAEIVASVCKKLDADEAIVPSHARHGFSKLWFGSTADAIVDAAPCTVIVLKMPEVSTR